MPLTLEETNSLVAALGVAVPPAVLTEKARAEEFTTRLKNTTAKASEKPADWWLKPKFDAAFKQASASAAARQFDPAFKGLDEANQLLLQPDAPPAAPPEPSKATEPPAAKPAEEPGTSLVQLQQSRLAWDSLRKRVQTQLKEIEQSILAGVKEHNADEAAEDQFEEAEVGAAIKTLHTI